MHHVDYYQEDRWKCVNLLLVFLKGYKRLLLTNREYTVGRADTDLVILDRSVSRLHARIFISYSEEVVEDGGIILPSMQITDLSRFGTFLNAIRISTDIPIAISSNSEVTFGVQPGVTFK